MTHCHTILPPLRSCFQITAFCCLQINSPAKSSAVSPAISVGQSCHNWGLNSCLGLHFDMLFWSSLLTLWWQPLIYLWIWHQFQLQEMDVNINFSYMRRMFTSISLALDGCWHQFQLHEMDVDINFSYMRWMLTSISVTWEECLHQFL